jgi:pimeloyl-ACP methyl ester carboxylesterase
MKIAERDRAAHQTAMPEKNVSTPTAIQPVMEAAPPKSILPVVLATGALALTGVGLAVIAWSRTRVFHHIPITAALQGDLIHFRGRRSGELAYYSAGPAKKGVPPLVLIHSVNAAASSYEMKPLFDYYSRSRRVVSLDLPGFGFADRSDRPYTPALYRDAILDLIEQELGNEAVDIVGLSLSSEFVAMAATASPANFRTITLISPTGMSKRNEAFQGSDVILGLLRTPLWARPFFDLLTSRPSLKAFLGLSQRTPVSKNTVNYAYAVSHQPDAEIAPYYFVAVKLFTPTIFQTYRALTQPSLLVYGRDPFTGYDRVGELAGKANWRVVQVENARALVHWDDPRIVITELDKLFARVEQGARQAKAPSQPQPAK